MKFLRISIISLLALAAIGCLRPVVIEGTAMSPTLADGERWFVTMNPGEIRRGDVIVFRYPKDETKQYIKRVVGLPGETIEIRGGVVHINGTPLTEEYIGTDFNKTGSSFPPKVVPENHYFVLGDNRDNSSDSRYWGTLDRSLIEGKLYMRYASGKNGK